MALSEKESAYASKLVHTMGRDTALTVVSGVAGSFCYGKAQNLYSHGDPNRGIAYLALAVICTPVFLFFCKRVSDVFRLALKGVENNNPQPPGAEAPRL